MAGAKRELEDAVSDLEEDDAELVLSLVHYLRARESEGGRPSGKDDASLLAQWVGLLRLLETLNKEGSEPILETLLDRLEDGSTDRLWLGLAEPTLARDWDRPEEDEAWADL